MSREADPISAYPLPPSCMPIPTSMLISAPCCLELPLNMEAPFTCPWGSKHTLPSSPYTRTDGRWWTNPPAPQPWVGSPWGILHCFPEFPGGTEILLSTCMRAPLDGILSFSFSLMDPPTSVHWVDFLNKLLVFVCFFFFNVLHMFVKITI